MEHLPIVCEHTNTELGVLPRPEAIKTGAWCRSTDVYIMNSDGQILCHQRSMEKERNPGCWSTHVGGHVGVGETYDTNALKELEEEAGVKKDAKQLIQWRTAKNEKGRLWVRKYVVLHDAPESAFIPQPGEVESFKWHSLEEIMKMTAEHPELWMPGTPGYDFTAEYEAMRAALVVAHNLGACEIPDAMHVWKVAIA
jgi:isopentenyldiphosphate isomerase